MKEKKTWCENEAPVSKWIMTLIWGLVLGAVFAILFSVILQVVVKFNPSLGENGENAVAGQLVSLLVPFSGMFWGMVICIRKVAKTSIKSFILGAGESETKKVNVKKDVLPILGLYFAGLILAELLTVKNVRLSENSSGTIVAVVILSIIFTWMQTSWEEFVFRGIPFRMICKNEIGLCRKAIITSVISSILFMIMHVANPEVGSVQGYEVIFMVLVYFIAGFLMALCDMLVGNILPGLLIHWLNNLFAFAILSASVSVAGCTTIFVDTTEMSGFLTMIITIISYAPVTIYLIYKYKKQKMK